MRQRSASAPASERSQRLEPRLREPARDRLDAQASAAAWLSGVYRPTAHLAPSRPLLRRVTVICGSVQSPVWFASTDYIRANRPLIKRYMDTAYQTAKFVNARPATTNAILAKYSKVPLETVSSMMRTQFAEAPDPGSCRLPLDYAYKYKILARPLTVEDLMATAG